MTIDPIETEEDKQRWFEAHKQLKRMPHEIRLWLDQQEPEYREDMRRRLNEMRENRRAGYDTYYRNQKPG